MEHIIVYFLGITGIVIVIIFLILIYIICTNDDVEEIDNTDYHIICGNTGKPCIKDKLYTKWNNCDECPFNEK